MPYTGKVKLQNEAIVQIIGAIAPHKKRMCTTYLLSIVCEGRVTNNWIFRNTETYHLSTKCFIFKIHSLRMNILKDITNLFSLLNRVYKCDYILMALLIKPTSKFLPRKGDPETTGLSNTFRKCRTRPCLLHKDNTGHIDMLLAIYWES